IRELRRKIQRGMVQANLTVTIPEDRLSEATYTETLRVDADNIQVPPGILTEIAEDTFAATITAHRLTECLLPVKFDYTGDVRVTQIEVEPATVLVRGPKQVLDRVRALGTQPVALAPSEGVAETQVRSPVP